MDLPMTRPSFPARRSLLAAALVLGLIGCDRIGAGKPAFKAIDVTGAEYARGFSLPDADGTLRTLADFKGKVVVVFFGYTQCPDVCPTTMTELAEVKRSLGADGARVVGVFISVDPERDTGELLKAYMANFGADFVGLRGTPEQVAQAAKEFKVFYAKVPGKTETSYTIDHTAGSYVFDVQGRIRLFTRYGSGAKALADDLKLLLAETT
jgi:protein SCO1/2